LTTLRNYGDAFKDTTTYKIDDVPLQFQNL